MNEMLGSWVDGVEGHSVPIDDRGLQYGDGLFETMLARNGRVRFLDAHLARMRAGCGRLAIPVPDEHGLRAEFATALIGAPAVAILKLIVTRGSGKRRGYAPVGESVARRVLTLFASPPVTAEFRNGVDARVATQRLGISPALAGIKHLNRLENVLAASESRSAGEFESLMLDTTGDLTCGTLTNVFIVKAGRVLTPLLDRCGVAGVARGVVLRECAASGIQAEERRLALSDLFGADEAFITNARIGVVPLRRVGEHAFPMNHLTLRLAARIEALDA